MDRRWDIGRSRDKFSPDYQWHEKFSTKGHGKHPIDKYLRPGRIPHIWCSGCGLGIAMTCFIKALDESGSLAGQSFCITGDLSMPRPKIHDWIKDQGGEVKGGVSKTLSYLVTSDPDSGTGKNKKADKYGVSKISEEDLYAIAGCRP